MMIGFVGTGTSTAWPSGLRRGTQVAVVQTAWVRTPPLSFCVDFRIALLSAFEKTRTFDFHVAGRVV